MLDSLDTLIAFSLIFTVVSLLITIVVQMISTACNLRGRNLSWALAETFEAIEPTLAAKAKAKGKTLADHVLEDPLIADKQIFGKVMRATALRPHELFDVLHRIATGKKTGVDANIQKDVLGLFVALGVSVDDLKKAGETVKNVQNTVADMTNLVNSLPDADKKKTLISVLGQISAAPQNAANQVATSVADAQARIDLAFQKFESWLTTGQERAQEWFTMHARMATLLVAIGFAYAFQLDAVEIFREASTNRIMRDKLVAQTENVLGEGQKILAVEKEKNVLEIAFTSWKSKQKDPIKAALDANTFNIAATDTRESFLKKVERSLSSVAAKDEASKAAVGLALEKLDDGIVESVHNALKEKSVEYKRVRAGLEGAGFSLLPTSDTGRWGIGWLPWKISFGHWLGMTFSVLLLSLGAPFWFNTLKSLASLRSTVAGNISDERKTEKAKPGETAPAAPAAPALPAAPVTVRV
jgi:hypothetical protein